MSGHYRFPEITKMISDTNLLYQPCAICGGLVETALKLSLTEAEQFQNDYERIAKAIYNGTFKGTIDPKMTKFIAAKLAEATIQGYGKSPFEVEFGTEDFLMTQHLLTNVYQFSAAKNHSQLKQMTELVSENGQVRPWANYKKNVDQLNVEYNKTWLKTEYNFAIAAAQNASRWASFDKDANLKYMTAADARVRDSHAAIHGTTRPKNDSFWNTHYPPNGYGCRCYTIETLSTETPFDKINHVDIPPMFQTNLAKDRLVFPKDHPYFKEGSPFISTEAKLLQVQDAREAAKAWKEEHITKNKPVVLDVKTELFDKIHVYASDIKSIVSHPHKNAHLIYPLATKLDSIFKNAKYLDWSYDAKDKHFDVHKWHYFEIMIEEEPSYINVKETTRGEFRVYCINDHFDKSKINHNK